MKHNQPQSPISAACLIMLATLLSVRVPLCAQQKLMSTVTNDGIESRYSDQELLRNSQISYRADGGFTEVKNYGVIISCVNGKISVLKTILDPRLPDHASTVHDVSSMSQTEYLALWDNLDRQAFFQLTNAPEPKMDIDDEFTVTFNAKVGDAQRQFRVHGIARPEAARYFAVRQLIDDSVHMQALWNVHSNIARIDQDQISE